MDHDTTYYRDLFFKTAHENIDNLNRDLANLSAGSDQTLLDKIFLSIHSLKGKSYAMGFSQLAVFAASAENFFYEIKMGKRVITEETIFILKEFVETFVSGLDGLEETNKEIDLSAQTQRFVALL